MSGGAIADAADLRLDWQDTKTAVARFALLQTGRLRVGRYEKSDASGLRPIYKVLLLSDKSFLIDTPFFWRGQKVKG